MALLKLIKHLADTTCVLLSAACPVCCHPLNFLNMVDLSKGSKSVPHTPGLDQTNVLYVTYLVLVDAKAMFLLRQPMVLWALEKQSVIR